MTDAQILILLVTAALIAAARFGYRICDDRRRQELADLISMQGIMLEQARQDGRTDGWKAGYDTAMRQVARRDAASISSLRKLRLIGFEMKGRGS
jgi:hypothetical protein